MEAAAAHTSQKENSGSAALCKAGRRQSAALPVVGHCMLTAWREEPVKSAWVRETHIDFQGLFQTTDRRASGRGVGQMHRQDTSICCGTRGKGMNKCKERRSGKPDTSHAQWCQFILIKTAPGTTSRRGGRLPEMLAIETSSSHRSGMRDWPSDRRRKRDPLVRLTLVLSGCVVHVSSIPSCGLPDAKDTTTFSPWAALGAPLGDARRLTKGRERASADGWPC